ncbi:MAG: SDR family NAD(P)-dependent oxidoreductase [Chloroflexota bacterium]|nr:MAG: SDR family NAD(P)-dependent oxidoreductase [Chloroflexota bacterium]
MLLEGKVAVVTGSGAGLGRAYALALAKAGAKVVVNARTANDVAQVVAEIETAGGTAERCISSVASMEGGRQTIQTAIDKFGRIDILVNNAGITRPKLLTEMTEQDFDDVIATNLKGTFACTKHAVPYMIEQKWGRIINVASGAVRGVVPQTNYAASKGGVLSMSLTWALELAKYGITCNVIRTHARTRMTERSIEQARQAALERHEQPPTASDLGIYEPESAAPLVVFLASDQACKINGQFISIDGPRLAICAHTRPVVSAISPGGWTVEHLLEDFKTTVGTQLESPGNFQKIFDGVASITRQATRTTEGR